MTKLNANKKPVTSNNSDSKQANKTFIYNVYGYVEAPGFQFDRSPISVPYDNDAKELEIFWQSVGPRQCHDLDPVQMLHNYYIGYKRR